MRLSSVLQAGALWTGLMFLVPAVGLGQEAPPPDPLNRAELGLTDEQKEQIRQIRDQQREKLQAIRADESLTPEERRAQAHKLREETRAQMGAVLTPQQKEKLQQHRSEHREKMRKRGRRGPGGRGGPGRPGGSEGPPDGPQE